MKKTVTIFSGILATVLALGILLFASFELTYQKRAYPGTTIGGIKVAGLTTNQIESVLDSKTSQIKSIALKLGVSEWTIPLSNAGVFFDNPSSAREAIGLGRSSDWKNNLKTKLAAMLQGTRLNPVLVVNNTSLDQAIASISSQIDIPAKEPSIEKTGEPAEIIISKGENGQKVNSEELKANILRNLTTFTIEKIQIPVSDIRPQLTEDQINRSKSQAEKLIGKILTISLADENQKWQLKDEELLTWIDLKDGGWNSNSIKNWLEELAKAVDRPAQNASFRWIGTNKVEEFKPAKYGLSLNLPLTLTAVENNLEKLINSSSDQTVELVTDQTQPEISNTEVNSLGIKELIGKGESWFTSSITNRIYNLKKAAETINGILVAPGDTFSFNQTVGEVSSDTGYKQAYIIKDGKTILGDGGGVCQVSTTLFRAVLDTGMPIVSRTAHAYRVSYYEVNYQPGFDATVFQPDPDFKFTNDTPGYILIQTVYDEKQKYLSFEIYGTNDGRRVEVSKARIWDVVTPPPDLYVDDPNLESGKIVQTEHASRGAKVAFDWKVTRGNEILQQRTFYSNYRPWQAVYLRGTKTN